MGKQFLSKMDFPFISYDKKLVFFAKNGQLLSVLCTRGKNLSFPICAVNFCDFFCTCSPISIGQDLIVKMQKNNFFSFGLLELEMAALRGSLRKNNSVL
jgi:hypothetical protein